MIYSNFHSWNLITFHECYIVHYEMILGLYKFCDYLFVKYI
jgi:hypothetical protein